MAREDRDSQYGGGGGSYSSADNRSNRGQSFGGNDNRSDRGQSFGGNDNRPSDRIVDIATNRLDPSRFTNIVEASTQYDPFERFRNQQMGDIPAYGITGLMANLLKQPLQKGMTYNRNFFVDNVLPSGRFTTEDFASMPFSQQQDLYRQYLQGRSSGEIDAYGNQIFRSDRENPLVNLYKEQMLAMPQTQETQGNLQGGVAELYNQYLQNLGYTL